MVALGWEAGSPLGAVGDVLGWETAFDLVCAAIGYEVAFDLVGAAA